MTVLRIEGAADPVDGRLPILSGLPHSAGHDGAEVDDEMRHNLGYGRPRTLLPYTRQMGYSRERSQRELPTVVLENEVLTATFLPGYGGRLWSLLHRPTGRELLHRNPILQPANLGLRDAWIAGGVEWNLGMTGHWPLTCEPLHAVAAETADGTPVLRMFEFERLRRLVLRIDAWLPAGSPVLLVRVSVHNPADEVTPVYWWSNIAVPESEGVRVVGPAVGAYHFDYLTNLRRVGFPEVDGADRSYPATADRAADWFLDLPDGQRRWIAALDEGGSGLVHASTELLRGRKLFHWGTSQGGRRWQEWLSGPGSAYLEIQAGLARTQLEHLPMPGGATWSWVEAYGRLDVDAAAVHGNWPTACSAVEEALARLVPAARLEQELETAVTETGEVFCAGSGWGGLEGLPGFPEPGPVQRPWQELLVTSRLPAVDPPAAPLTGARWRALLESSADDWHAWYHLALMRLSDGDVDGAQDACLRSVNDRVTPWAIRVLGFLTDSPREAADLLFLAHRLDPASPELAAEALEALVADGRTEVALAVIEGLPYRDLGRFRLIAARAGDEGSARQLLAEGIEVDDLREGEDSLDRLWLRLHPGEPVPAVYDFRIG
ncbi:DUF5107 domain-containing protein [Nonomuraea soli]|uniref:DUF5107 domain-containing protein n=1 Tax=Nonomuraea soli TaxID=1032476 RepID=A0A7W0CJI8_9ACTN|nr:DUF5107 domain-containing protein [Nonomuraea soli]MBA2892326.1 hypothetical protein [Nonomuraea soli]